MATLDELATLGGTVGDYAREKIDSPALPLETPQQTESRQMRAALQQDRVQRMRGRDFAAQGIPTYTDSAGSIQPITDESGQPLQKKRISRAWTALGEPRDISFTPSGPKLSDPYEAIEPKTDRKTGEIYKVSPGLPKRVIGQDASVISAKEEGEKNRAISQAAITAQRKLTLDDHAAITSGHDFKNAQKQLAGLTGRTGFDPQSLGESVESLDSTSAHKAVDDHFNSLYGSPQANATKGLFSNERSPQADQYRSQLDQDKAETHKLVDRLLTTKARNSGAITRAEQSRRLAEELQSRKMENQLASIPGLDQPIAGGGAVYANDIPEDRLAPSAPPSFEQPAIPGIDASPPAAPPGQTQAEGVLGTIGREFATKIAPAVGTAVGGAVGTRAGLAAGIESGPGAIATSAAGGIVLGAASGAAVDKLQHSFMGKEWTEQNERQLEANRQAHPIAAQLGSMVPFLISLSGGGPVSKLLGKSIGPLGERIATAALGGARAGLSEGSQERFVEGKDVNPLDTMLKDSLAFGATGIFAPAKSLLSAATGKAVTDAAAMIFANSLYDRAVHGKEIDFQEVANQLGGDIPAFMLQNAILGLVHGTPLLPKSSKPGSEPPPKSNPPAEPPPLPSSEPPVSPGGVPESTGPKISRREADAQGPEAVTAIQDKYGVERDEAVKMQAEARNLYGISRDVAEPIPGLDPIEESRPADEEVQAEQETAQRLDHQEQVAEGLARETNENLGAAEPRDTGDTGEPLPKPETSEQNPEPIPAQPEGGETQIPGLTEPAPAASEPSVEPRATAARPETTAEPPPEPGRLEAPRSEEAPASIPGLESLLSAEEAPKDRSKTPDGKVETARDTAASESPTEPVQVDVSIPGLEPLRAESDIGETRGEGASKQATAQQPRQPEGSPKATPEKGGTATTQKAAVSSPEPAKSAQPVKAQKPGQVLHDAPRVKVISEGSKEQPASDVPTIVVPKGTTHLRVTNTKGQVSERVPIGDLQDPKRESTLRHGGPYTKIEAQKMVRGKLETIPGKVRTESPQPPENPSKPQSTPAISHGGEALIPGLDIPLHGKEAQNLTPGVRESRGSGTAGKPLPEQAIRTILKEIHGINPENIRFTNNPKSAREAAFHVGARQIEINTARIRSSDQLDRAVHEELAHAYIQDEANGNPNLEQVRKILKTLTKEERAAVDEAIEKGGYRPGEVPFEQMAKGLQKLAYAWHDRPWYKKLVERVLGWFAEKGFPITRLTAERIAADAIVKATKEINKGPVERVGPSRLARSSREEGPQYARPPPEMDRAYMESVERGDMKEAQRLVDETAKAAGYETGPVFHGTTRKRVKFISPKKGVEVRDAAFFTDNEDMASEYTLPREYGETIYEDSDGNEITPGIVVKAYLKLKNPMRVDFEGDVGDAIKFSALVKDAKKNGHDGLIVENVRDGMADSDNEGTSYAVFESNQTKSADPITRDDSGRIIPLSERFNPESSDIRESRVSDLYDKAADSIKSTVKDAKSELTAREMKQKIVAGFDAGSNIANYHGEQAGNSIRLDLPEKKDREAMPFVIEADSVAELKKDKVTAMKATDAKLKARMEPLLDHAIANFDRLKTAQKNHDQMMKESLDESKNAGIDVDEVEKYVTRKLDLPENQKEMLPNPLFSIGDGKGSNPRYFTKGRKFKKLVDAIAENFVPKSTDLADLDAHRIAAGKRLVEQKKFIEGLKATKSNTDGKPIIGELEPRKTLKGETEMTVPHGYSSVNAKGRPIVVHNQYADVFRNLFGHSALRSTILGRGLMKAAAAAKAGTLVFDTFHVGRMLFKQASAGGGGPLTTRMGKPGWNIHKGLSLLEYKDSDLNRAVADGAITREEADYARRNRPKVEELMKAGLNVGRIADNLVQQAQLHLPVVGKFNDWIFQKLSRGAMLQSALVNYERNLAKMPQPEAARQTAKEMNELFGNLQNQGLFTNKTLQDFSRLLFLAPQWTESQARNELRAYGQAGKSAYNFIRSGGKDRQLGNSTRAFAAGFIGLLAANQVVNYLSRGQSTFQNSEDDHQLDAWIPGGKRGFWFSPLEIAGEYAHATMKYLAQHENPVDVATHIASNKLSPGARGLKDLATGRDFSGRHYLSNSDRVTAAIADAAPSPLPFGAVIEKDPRATLGYRWTRQPGALEKQLLQSVGAKVTPAQSPRSTMFALAQPFRADRGKSDTAGEYTEMRRALDNDNETGVRNEIKWLLGRGKTPELIRASVGLRKDGSIKSEIFTGSAEREAEMLKTFNPEHKEIYDQAQKDHRDNAKKFLRYSSGLLKPSKPVLRSPSSANPIGSTSRPSAFSQL